MKSKKAKTLAAKILKVGESKIWIDPQNVQKVSEAITKEDVRSLITSGVIKKVKDNQKTSATRAGHKGRRKTGPGKKRGKAGARIQVKKKWISQVRAQRRTLKEIKQKSKELKVPYRKAYAMVKGGFFKGKKYVQAFVAGVKK